MFRPPHEEFVRLDLKRRRDAPEHGDACRYLRALDRPEIARADMSPVRQFLLRETAIGPEPAYIDGHDIPQVHSGRDRRSGTIVLGTIVPIRPRTGYS